MPIIGNICKAESYTDKEGVERTKWHDVGTLWQKDDGKYSVKIWGEWCQVFPPKPKEEVKSKTNEIDHKDLPF